MGKLYATEKEGQIDFYSTFLPRIAPGMAVEDILSDNNDGVLNGNLIEFKLNVTDLNGHLFQCIKYLSQLRIKGKPVPAEAVIIDLNESMAWVYDTKPYLTWIETVYQGGASKNNTGFPGGSADKKIDYKESDGAEALISILKEKNFTKIHIDENCIVGWANTYYRANPGARKEDFLGDDTGKHTTIGEIRKPVHLKDYILPYDGETNIKFKYLMDKLNDTLQKKNLGAFYTHDVYAEKSLELVRMAIGRVPEGNDYIILDRCAGTGNLEAHMTDEELSHCIVSTVEYYEYKVLQEILGPKVRHIVPPVETKDTFNMGLVAGADALSEEYQHEKVISKYVDDPKCTVILFENPPYAETTSIEHQKKSAGKISSEWKKSYMMEEMRKDPDIKGTSYNDLGNLFIWSGFKKYVKKPFDSFIVYSPIKYWKAHGLINKQFIKGFAFNRRHFHTDIDACIICALWGSEDAEIDEFTVEAYDIDKNGKLVNEGTLPIRRVHTTFSHELYDKRTFPDDIAGGIYADFDGKQSSDGRTSVRIRPITNENIVAYLAVKGANFDNPDSSVHLLRVGAYDANGFYIRNDSYLDKLPMFCASRYITYNARWTERSRVMKSADRASDYLKDVENGKLDGFLMKCLIFTCLEMQNHCLSIRGRDGLYYRNELSLDDTHGDTLATKALKGYNPDQADVQMLKAWEVILKEAKECEEYDPGLTYGLYQVYADLDTFTVDEENNKTWNHKELHSALQTMKTLIREYYNQEIVPTLFEYEFLK